MTLRMTYHQARLQALTIPAILLLKNYSKVKEKGLNASNDLKIECSKLFPSTRTVNQQRLVVKGASSRGYLYFPSLNF